MKAHIFRISAIVLFITASAHSCDFGDLDEHKYIPDCNSGGCVTVNIKGAVYVKPSGTGLNKIPVEVKFIKKSGVWFPETNKVVSGKTNKNGEFNFQVTIDTMDFEGYRLLVNIPKQENYVSLEAHPSIGIGTVQRWFEDFEEEALQNIKIEYYKKAILTINLNRTQIDDFEDFYLTYSFDGNPGFWAIERQSLNSLNDTFQFETAADVYTKISWRKGGQYYTDSLICKQNSKNVINIDY